MESFEEGENGIAEMPEYYNGLHDRKVVDDDKSLGARLKNPNKYAAMIVGVVLVVLLVLIFIIVLIVKLISHSLTTPNFFHLFYSIPHFHSCVNFFSIFFYGCGV